jgi:subtilisin family serine protease
MGGDVLAEMSARVKLAAIGGLAVVVGAAGAAPALSVTPEAEGPETGQAIVAVSTPELPSGRSFAARQRWERLRDRSGGLLDGVAERNDLEVELQIPEIGMLVVDLGAGGLPALRRDLEGEPRVESIRPDLPVELRYQPNDFAFNHLDSHAPNGDYGQWNLLRSGTVRAWDLSKGSGAEVAVLDSGADGNHPDLGPRIVGSGDFGTGTSPTVDTFGHGTHTAGLACADSDNGFGIASLGFDCGLYIAKIDLECSAVANAITAAGNRFSDVISMSFGGCDTSLNSALSYALSRGSVLVAAGANEATPNPSTNHPAQWVQPEGTGPQVGFDRGLVVTSAKYNGTRSGFAQMTSGVSVAAFGSASDALSGGQQGILSTFPNNTTDIETGALIPPQPPCQCRTTVGGSNDFAYLVGTSMATPQVAGLAALIRSVRPTISAPRVSHLIKQTASHCGAYRDGIGWGVIRADEAVEAALDRDVDPPSSRVRSAKRARRAAVASTAATGGRIINLRLKRKDPAGKNCAAKLPAAGVKTVAVFASANGGAYHRIGKTKKKRLRFRAKARRKYRFYSIAVDKAGNREAAPAKADAKL